MRVKLQLVICYDDGYEDTVTDAISLNKTNQRIEHLGLSLAESKQLLSIIQRQLLQQQVGIFLDTDSTCPDCGTRVKLKARGNRSFRALFGTFKFYSPRLEHCDCKRRKTTSFRPLSALLTEPVAPELLYMEAKWSSLVSYGLSLDAFKDFLPIDVSLDVKTVRYDTLKMAKRLEAVLGEVICDQIERLKWSLWHGQVDKALSKIDDLESSIQPFSETYDRYAGLVKALSELLTYVTNNRHLIPNYGERYRNREPIATGFVESTVNEVVSRRFCKKQSMQWSKEGAHLLLQTRVRTLNGELAGIFKRWYPDLDVKAEAIPIAA